MLALDKDQIAKAMNEIAEQIVINTADDADIAVVGIMSKGIFVGQRLAKMLSAKLGREIECGSTDMTLYRDDIHDPEKVLNVQPTDIPFDVDGKTIILADDVLQTGRSCRAAMDSVIEFGRPAAIRLATLIDRDQREFPIRADYVGKRLDVADDYTVMVLMEEIDGIDEVRIVKKQNKTENRLVKRS